MQAVGTFSGLTSTSYSSTILPSVMAAVAMSLCTNLDGITAQEKNITSTIVTITPYKLDKKMPATSLSSVPFSFSLGDCLLNS